MIIMCFLGKIPKLYSSFMVLLSFAIIAMQLGAVSAGHRKIVRILDLIPPNNNVQPSTGEVSAHCRSKNNDLGVWNMTQNSKKEIHFRPNIWKTTLFWCDFRWGTKAQGITVYDASDVSCDGERYCNWNVKTDGFYFAKGEFPKEADFTKKSDWRGARKHRRSHPRGRGRHH
ncbi:unnamed protein product [Cuscuta epithymum]|uniref:S-protein homolog n=1 Tax=Cuscuta epithymum TaxID=186058 RepID=A0AAV0FSW3_9ASTE|nr:unnamed protein product [Cuscuta epithymum]